MSGRHAARAVPRHAARVSRPRMDPAALLLAVLAGACLGVLVVLAPIGGGS